MRSTERTFQYWADLAGYQEPPNKINLPDTDPTDGRTIERYTYKKLGEPEVTLLKVIGGSHDTGARDMDVYQEAWAFFMRQLGD